MKIAAIQACSGQLQQPARWRSRGGCTPANLFRGSSRTTGQNDRLASNRRILVATRNPEEAITLIETVGQDHERPHEALDNSRHRVSCCHLTARKPGPRTSPESG